PGPDRSDENSLRERVMDSHDASGMGGFYRLEEAYNSHFHPRNTGVTATVRNPWPSVNPARTYPSRGASAPIVGSILSLLTKGRVGVQAEPEASVTLSPYLRSLRI